MKSLLPLILSIIALPLFSQSTTIQVDRPYLRVPIDHSGQTQQLLLCGLEEGMTYKLVATDKQRNCNHQILIENHPKVQQESASILHFLATSSCQEVTFIPGCIKSDLANLTIYCEDCEGTQYQKVMAGISTSVNNNAQSLIQDVFIGGGCFDVAGAFKKGATGQLGTFSNGGSSIGIEEGVILSTGNIGTSAGPNQAPDAGTDYGLSAGDPDLSELTGGGSSIFDVAAIEFDFTPTVGQISFRYVFASEEYCEWVGSQFNDVFGFFIRGPGINGDFFLNADNIAVLPSGDYVAINSVNSNSNPEFYHDNSPNATGCATGEQFALMDIEYDGFTTVLTAVANVQPCQTYHIKLAVGDRGDGIYDSAVFLEANSFAAGSTTNMTADILGPGATQNIVYESCGSAVITFQRFTNDLSQPFTVNFNLSNSSTATPGVDYSAFPTSITIPAGQSSISIPIEVFADFITEGIETIVLELQGACTCESNELIIQIVEPPPIDVSLEDLVVCQNQTTTIFPNVSGGTPGFTYQWSNNTFGPSLSIDVGTEPEAYSLTVTDVCGQSSASGLVVYPNAPTAELSGTDSICQGNFDASLLVEFTGIGPFDLTYSVEGFITTITNIYGNQYMLPANLPGTYQLLGVSAANCPGEVSGLGEVGITDVLVDVDPVPVSCFGEADGAIFLNPTGGSAPYDFNWNQGLPDSDTITGLSPGTYNVTVTDASGCIGTTTATIDEPNAMTTNVVAVESIDCSNPEGGEIAIAVSGGSGGFTYEWSDGSVDSVLTNAPAGDYTVTVTDASGCSSELSATIESFIAFPTAVANVSGVLNCVDEQVTLDPTGSSSGNNFSYEWFDEMGNLVNTSQNSFTQNQPGDYLLIITNDQNHCQDSAQLTIMQDIEPPEAIAGGTDTLTCEQPSIQLDGSQSSNGNNIEYAWTTIGGNFVDDPGMVNPTIDGPGLYILELTNSTNGCIDQDTVAIAENTTIPNVAIATPGIINCNTPQLTLDGSNSDFGDNLVYSWTTPDGTILSPTDSTSVEIAEGGLYTLSILDNSNGCENEVTVTVAEDLAAPIADPGTLQELDCETSTATLNGSGSSTGNDISYLWQTDDGFIIGDSTSLNPTVGEAGNYLLIVTNETNGCSAQNMVTVTENTNAPNVEAWVQGILTCATTEIIIDASNSDSGSQFDIQWTGDSGQQIGNGNTLTPTVTEPGTYTLSILNTDNSCLSTISLPVNQNITPPEIEVGPDGLINCYEPRYTLEGSIINAGNDFQINWSNATGNIPGANDLNWQVEEAGTYTFSVFNNVNGCESTETVTVLADQTPPDITAGPDMVLNCATPTLNLQGNLNLPLTDFALEWTSPEGVNLADNTIFDPQVDQAGQYQLTVTNLDNGCSSQDAVQISANFAFPEANAGSEMTLNCVDTVLTIDGSSSSQGNLYDYTWSTTNGNLLSGQGTLLPQINAPGDYQLIVTNTENFCRDTAVVNISQDIALPVASIAPPEELTCELTAITLDVAGSSTGPEFEYIWTSPDGNIVSGANEMEPLVNEPGMYQLLIRNVANGCVTLAQTQVTRDPNIPIADAGSPLILNCTQTSVMLDGSASSSGANVVYNWEGIDAAPVGNPDQITIMANQPGLYVLNVTNLDNNCTASDTIPVTLDTIAPTAVASVDEVLTCTQNSVSLSGNGSSTGGGFSYQWSSPAGNSIQNPTSLTPTVSTDGVYQLQVTDTTNGCTQLTQVSVGIDTIAPVLSVAPPEILTCDLTALALSAQVQTAHDAVPIWTTANGSIVTGQNSLTPTIDEPGTYQLFVEDTVNGCTTSISVVVDQNITPPEANAGGNDILNCDVLSLQLDGSLSSSGHHTYQWSTADGEIESGAQSLTPTITEPGNYILLVRDLENGCEATDVVTINQDVAAPQVLVVPPAQLTCVVNSVNLIGQTDETTDPYTLQWYTADGTPIPNATTEMLTVTQPGTYQLLVTNTVNGCTETVEEVVEQDITTPMAEAGPEGTLTCNITELSLNGEGSSTGSGFIYSWQGPTTVSGASSLNPTVTSPGIYTLVVTNTGNGCTSEDQVEVTREVPRDAVVEVDAGPCVGDFSAILIDNVDGGFGPYAYSIDGGEQFQSSPSFTRLESGLYPIVVRDDNGCDFNTVAYVPDPLDLQVELDPLITIRLGENVTLYPQLNVPESAISSITWTPGDSLSCSDCLTPTVRPTQTTTYHLEVISEEGCLSTAEVTLRVDRRPAIYIPNAFSPHNLDGTNDRFYIFAKPNFVRKVKSLMIFNRWGEQVYEVYDFPPNDPQYGWDGTHRGQLLNPAVFVYWTEVELIDGTVLLLKGDVTLVN